jgi:hypothetical protein
VPEGLLAGNAAPRLADYDRDLAFLVEAVRRFRGQHESLLVADLGRRKPQEHISPGPASGIKAATRL